MELFLQPETWISLLTLTFLEIILGVDNIIFISIVTQKLPPDKRIKGQNIGLLLALILRIILLLFIGFIMGLTKNILPDSIPFEITGKGVILLLGGIFLIYKSTTEIHHKITGDDDEFNINEKEKSASFISVLIQIALLNLVFSFDSILTAIGIVKEIPIMIAAVVLSMLVMMKFTKPVSDLVNKFPSLQILALSFLIMIGVTLIMEGLGYEVEKSIIYVSVAFSFGVEILNIKYRKKSIKNS
ncbi:MAG: TerC family protein [Bacteroidetes bacterium]|jgi:predicted tellurium resistance membrane protein TerC|nr:TerC family protein [Bacteroidota bacterium]MBP7255839.1 TerC family protein [Chitinophagales bacterium]MBK7139691.1 TerC family protein [Bacteroidota bacterium]MBK7506080.1 TerC family protein [Bacteroidota bacterium]MBK7639584.1 TerC family protein [Bacteroidota bacterium]